jgi:hypothetical protein
VNKLVRQVLTGTIVLVGMGTIVLSFTGAAKAFVLEDDFQSTADIASLWWKGNSSTPSLPTEAPTAPLEGDPDYDIKKERYDIEKAYYDWYQARGLYAGWAYNKEPIDDPTANGFWFSGFTAGPAYEPDVTINTWFISPIVPLENGSEISFDTRQLQPDIANRLEVRYNITGSCRFQDEQPPECIDREGDGLVTPELAITVGDFIYQFLNEDGTPLVVNPELQPNGYPNEWTRFTGRINGLTQPTSGRLAFRYFVPEASFSQINGSVIGIDNVRYQTPVPTPALLPGLFAISWKTWRKRKHQAIA